MSENYEDIGKTAWGNIPKPKTLPTGSWRLVLNNASMQPSKKEGGSPSILFAYRAKQPMDDVDQTQIDELGADYDYGMNRIFYRAWLEDNVDADKVRKHLEKHGVDCPEDENIEDTLKRAKGSPVIAHLGVRTYVDKAGETHQENDPSGFTPVP